MYGKQCIEWNLAKNTISMSLVILWLFLSNGKYNSHTTIGNDRIIEPKIALRRCEAFHKCMQMGKAIRDTFVVRNIYITAIKPICWYINYAIDQLSLCYAYKTNFIWVCVCVCVCANESALVLPYIKLYLDSIHLWIGSISRHIIHAINNRIPTEPKPINGRIKGIWSIIWSTHFDIDNCKMHSAYIDLITPQL